MRAPIVILSLTLLSACSPQTGTADGPKDGSKIENPFRGVMQDRSSKSPDEALFVEKCSMCHRQMGMGTVILARRMNPKVSMLEARDDLTADFVKSVVRRGIGNMPRFGRGEVSDALLQRISTYLANRGSHETRK